jgi:hypothetical protein
MARYKLVILAAMLVLVLAVSGFFLGGQTVSQARGVNSARAESSIFQSSSGLQMTVKTADYFDVSPPLRSMKIIPPSAGPLREIPERSAGGTVQDNGYSLDPAVQKAFGPLGGGIPTPFVSFDGIPNIAGVAPPDPDGDVGPNHYVEMVNLHFQIFDKTGTSLFGPAANNTLFTGMTHPCEVENAGDPIVLHDQLADRWMLTQFTSNGPVFYNCVAISTTSDPTGTYYRYAFSTGPNFPDYPKYGVWPNAYFLSTREFLGTAGPFQGVGAYALERDRMLAGDPAARVVSFIVPPTPAYRVGDGLLPADLDGDTLPPDGSPNYWAGTMDDGGPYGAPDDAITFWQYQVDWADPSTATFTQTATLPTEPFDSIFPCTPTSRACIPQQGTTNKLDILSYRQRPTWRLAYRNFGTHESLVTNQSVEAVTGIAGVRWYEIRSPLAGPIIYQQGTYAPGATDGIHRWMGSIAMDGSGNMALGYSASSGTMFPSIWYTGRLVDDPLGEMPQGESSIKEGTGSQTGGGNRWGDYTAMHVDPTDDCTFWYTNEYIPVTSSAGWRGRIGAFKFPGCTGTVPTVTPGATATATPATAVPTSTATAVPPTATACSIEFTDVPSTNTFYSNIRCLACRGIIGGYSDNTFRPNNDITRGQIAKIVSQSAGFSDPAGTRIYEDVPESGTFFTWIQRLSNRGLVGGYPCDAVPSEPCVSPGDRPYFRPNASATRGQLSKIVASAADLTGTPTGQTYADVGTSSTFYVWIEQLSAIGAMGGYPCDTVPSEPCDAENRPYFRPNNRVTRGQASKIVANTFFPGCEVASR